MIRWNALLLGLLLTALPTYSLPAPEAPAPETNAQANQTLLKLLPEPIPAPAVAHGEPAFYGPNNLFQYMDGAADAFLSYDVKALLHQDLRVKDVDVSLDIFDMGAPENAFGMYAAERAPWFRFIPIGAEGYHNPEGSLNFLQGRYYVKLTSYGAGTNEVMEQIARGVSAKIGEKSSLPALVAQLPQTRLKPRSEQYLLKDPLGHSFLAPAYLATYFIDNQESMLLVSIATNEAEAQQRLKALDKHFRDTGKSEPAPDLGEGAIRASNSFEGKVIVRTKGRYLIALFNPVTGAQDVLKEAVDRLQ